MSDRLILRISLLRWAPPPYVVAILLAAPVVAWLVGGHLEACLAGGYLVASGAAVLASKAMVDLARVGAAMADELVVLSQFAGQVLRAHDAYTAGHVERGRRLLSDAVDAFTSKHSPEHLAAVRKCSAEGGG